MSSLFSSPKAPPPLPAPPMIEDNTGAEQAAADERKRRLQAIGRKATVLTSGLGDTTDPVTKKAELLGA